MGSVVGEKITRLIEYATNQFLPLIFVCAFRGARIQEGSLSLMQVAKITSALYDYQSNKKLFYVSILFLKKKKKNNFPLISFLNLIKWYKAISHIASIDLW
jgi:hypothetical protein